MPKMKYTTLIAPAAEKLKIPFEIGPVIGHPLTDRNRHYKRFGPMEEVSCWFDAISEYFGPMLTPGQVLMYCPLTRNAVYKAMESNCLTVFEYEVDGFRSDLWKAKDQKKSAKYTFIPLVEVREWRRDLERRYEVEKHLADLKIKPKEMVSSNYPKEYLKFWEWYLTNEHNHPWHIKGSYSEKDIYEAFINQFWFISEGIRDDEE